MKFSSSLVAVLAALLLSRYVYRRLRRGALERGAIALITGGGSGVGEELAYLFASAGCRVVLVGRQEDALRRVAQACETAGAPQADVVVADLSTADGTAHVGTEFARLYPTTPLKYLVLNAGAGAIVPFFADERFERVCVAMMAINYFANVRLLQIFLPQLARCHTRQSPSRVLVMSSLAGVLPSILRSPYTASKHAIQGFLNALRGETDVPITICCPGYIDTSFHQRVLTRDGQPLAGHQRRGIAPAACARTCVNGMLHGDAEVIFSLSGKLGYVLRPVMTGVVDYMAKRKSLKSIES